MVQNHDRGGIELSQVLNESIAACVGLSQSQVCLETVEGNLLDTLHLVDDDAQKHMFMLEHNDMILDSIRPGRLAKAGGQIHHGDDVPTIIHHTNDVRRSLGNRGETW